MQEGSKVFWIFPILCLVIVIGVIFPFILYHLHTEVYPNAEVEIVELKAMSCPEIQARNAIGSYWTPTNGKFAFNKVQDCKDISDALKEELRIIRTNGTHQEKIEAGFTKLWFGVYDHPKLPHLQVAAQVKRPMGTTGNNDWQHTEVFVIIGYNNTIVFTNEDDTGTWFTSNVREFSTSLLKPNQSESIVISQPGTYGYHSAPWETGTITAVLK